MQSITKRVLITAIYSLVVPSLALAAIPSQTTPQKHFFVAGYAGIQKPNVNGSMQIDNGSNYPIPYNFDNYSTTTNTSASAALETGYRWYTDTKYIPTFAVSVRYQHVFSNDIGNKIQQYSLSDFTNYTYQWNVVSDVFVLLGKLDLFECHHIMPYITAGGGVTYNRAKNYSETPYPGITPRISPGFNDNTSTYFTYQVGAGLDWQINSNVIASLDYAYQNLGGITSQAGEGSWSTSSLSTGKYHINTLMLGVSYLL